jgi:hypothetical protein
MPTIRPLRFTMRESCRLMVSSLSSFLPFLVRALIIVLGLWRLCLAFCIPLVFTFIEPSPALPLILDGDTRRSRDGMNVTSLGYPLMTVFSAFSFPFGGGTVLHVTPFEETEAPSARCLLRANTFEPIWRSQCIQVIVVVGSNTSLFGLY